MWTRPSTRWLLSRSGPQRTAEVPARMAPADVAVDQATIGEVLERGEADLAQHFALHRDPLVVPAREEARLEELLGDGVDGRIRAQLLRRGHEPVDVDRDLGPEAEAVTRPSDHQVGSGLAQPPQRGPEAGAHL